MNIKGQSWTRKEERKWASLVATHARQIYKNKHFKRRQQENNDQFKNLLLRMAKKTLMQELQNIKLNLKRRNYVFWLKLLTERSSYMHRCEVN